MRIVPDTNILIAAFLSRGACHELLEHCVGEHEMLSSVVLIDEFEGTLLRKFKIAVTEARQARVLIESSIELVQPAILEGPVSRDPDDDRVLATALSAGCECILTGDADLLVLDGWQGIRVLKPSEFWAFEARRESPLPDPSGAAQPS